MTKFISTGMCKALVVLLVVLMTGCASYTPKMSKFSKPTPDTEENLACGVTVTYEKYTTSEKCEHAFDCDLLDEQVLPIYLTLSNSGQWPYEVNSSDMKMHCGIKDYRQLTPAEAASAAKKDAVGRAIGWSLIVPIIAIPIAAAASAHHTGKVNQQMLADFQAKSFQEGIIEPGKDRSGFVFFEIPEKDPEDYSQLVFEMKLRNVETDELARLSFPARGPADYEIERQGVIAGLEMTDALEEYYSAIGDQKWIDSPQAASTAGASN